MRMKGSTKRKKRKGKRALWTVSYCRSWTSQKAAGVQTWEVRERSCHRRGSKDRQTQNTKVTSQLCHSLFCSSQRLKSHLLPMSALP